MNHPSALQGPLAWKVGAYTTGFIQFVVWPACAFATTAEVANDLFGISVRDTIFGRSLFLMADGPLSDPSPRPAHLQKRARPSG